MTDSSLVALSLTAQHYAWGKPGNRSKVAQLLSKSGDTTTRYAELWMGTHKNGPSKVVLADKQPLLSEYLGTELPYLFKVLSVDKSLSIQAHPNKQLAKQLHAERPNIYKDANHKPEMAVALTPFEAMCGFRPSSQISFFLQNVPEFKRVVGADIAQSFIDSADANDAPKLKAVFTAVMTADTARVQKEIDVMLKRLDTETIPAFNASEKEEKEEKNNDSFVRDLDLNELVKRLNAQYVGDVGVFAAFMLNCFRLKPGEAVFLAANLPHAYLDGDCLECMACSDNVVRAGLTPKLRDTNVLCAMLNYTASLPNIMSGANIGSYTVQYRAGADISEFRLDRTMIVGKNKETLNLHAIDGCASKHASIILVYEGSGSVNGKPVKQGDCLLATADVEQLTIENRQDEITLKLARCYAPSS